MYIVAIISFHGVRGREDLIVSFGIMFEMLLKIIFYIIVMYCDLIISI